MKNTVPGLLFFASIALVSGHSEAQGTAPGVLHVARANNSSSNSTYLDHPSLNGRPGAIAFVTPLHSASSKHVGLWYDTNRQRWAIFNQDKSAMEANRSFHVIATPPSAMQPRVHTASSANTNTNWTYLDSTDTNNIPTAIVFVTQRWNGASGGYNPRPVGVWYDTNVKKWAIYNEDKSPMTAGLQFNVMVAAAPSSTANPAINVLHTSGNTKLPRPLGGANDILLVTHSYQSSGPYLNAYFDIGIEPDSSLWMVSSPSSIQTGTIFNVLTVKR